MKKYWIIGCFLLLCCTLFYYLSLDTKQGTQDIFLQEEPKILEDGARVLEDEGFDNISEELIFEEETFQEEAIPELSENENYPRFGILEEDEGDEETFFKDNEIDDEELGETSKILMEALTNYTAEMNNSKIQVSIDDQTYSAYLENNESAHFLVENFLNQELTLNELNGNEKYVYIDKKFPSSPSVPSQIEAGDIMLYGDNCIVVFYKSFSTNYSYTKLGHIDGLKELGEDNISLILSQ